MMWKTQQAMQDDAIRTARIHSAVHPANRDEVFIWQNFQPAYRDLSISFGLPLEVESSMTLNVKANGAVDGSGVCSAMDDSSRAGSKIGR